MQIEDWKSLKIIYIKGYVEDSTDIIKKLQELASSGVPQYTESVDSWILRESYTVDDDSKKEALRQMFTNSHVALTYGSAGTGKSTLIKHVANFWADKDKLFLANIFSPLIHNNSKGKIVRIRPEEQQIWFDIELEESINGIDAWGYDFELIGESDAGNSIISFSVNKYRSTDEDDDINDSTVVPFQVAYAVSIHKAQGLEYNSVKIVITNETEERITHNIFYTAITRAKNKLKIYWSPETEQSVLSRLEVKNSNRDAHLLALLSSLEMK